MKTNVTKIHWAKAWYSDETFQSPCGTIWGTPTDVKKEVTCLKCALFLIRQREPKPKRTTKGTKRK